MLEVIWVRTPDPDSISRPDTPMRSSTALVCSCDQVDSDYELISVLIMLKIWCEIL